jgi:prepilin peptidase CpaA
MQELNVLPEVLARFLTQPRTAVLVALLLAAAIIDWRTYRIPNWLTVGGMAFGLIYAAAAHPGTLSAFMLSLAGLATGLIVLLPVYALRVMGAGDVKLMAAVGAIVGFPDILWALLCTLAVGGLVAIAFAVYRKSFRRMSSNVADIVQNMAFAAIAGYQPTTATAKRASIGKFPYGVSIALGTFGWLAARQLGYA